MDVVKVSEALKDAYVCSLSEELQNKIMAAVDESLRQWDPAMDEEAFKQGRKQALNSRVCDLDGAIKIEFVPGELSFYVVDNLRSQQDGMGSFKVTKYDDLEKAIESYSSFPKEYTSAIGFSLIGGKFGIGEFDFVHRRNGDSVLVNDFRFDERWDHPLVHEAVQNLVSKLHIEYESDVRMFGKTVLVPLRKPEDEKLNTYFMDKYLRPKEGAEREVARKYGDLSMYAKTDSVHTKYLLSAINEVYVDGGAGWMQGAEFFKKLDELREYDTPERLKVSSININYVDLNGREGQADIQPHQFALLKKQTIERTAEHPDLDAQIEMANKIREQAHQGKEKSLEKEKTNKKHKQR